MYQIEYDILKAQGHIRKSEIYLKYAYEYKSIGAIEKYEWCIKKMKKQLKKADRIHEMYS